MPNDSSGQFPVPTTSTPIDNQPPTYESSPTPSRDVPLTDEVAPDLSATPPQAERTPLYDVPTPQSEPKATPLYDQPPTPEPAPAHTPPTQPPPLTPATAAFTPSRPFPIVTLLLLLVSIAGIAAAYFFYQQNTALNQQIGQIERTLEQQRIQENQATPTPTALPTIEVTPTSTFSASPTATLSPSPASTSVFGKINSVLATATAKYPNAQLIMITVTGVENPTTAITKYWFRQSQTDKRYLYILSEANKDLALVDQQVYVTPDDNIPSLNEPATTGQLGLDLTEAVSIAAANCPPNFSCNFTPTSGQFIKAGTTLWQISYKPTSGAKPFVIQIDSQTKKILYKNQ